MIGAFALRLTLQPSFSLQAIRAIARDPAALPPLDDDRFVRRRTIVVEPGRMRPSWDTTERGNLRDFDAHTRAAEGRARLWLFQIDRPEVPWLSDIWLQNGHNRPLSLVRATHGAPQPDCPTARYRIVMPREAVRILTVDTLVHETEAPALRIEVATGTNPPARHEVGPTAWEDFPLILERG